MELSIIFYLLVSSFFHLPSKKKKKKQRLIFPTQSQSKSPRMGTFILTSPLLWSDITTTKWRLDPRKLLHNSNIIHTPHLDVSIQKPNSPWHHTHEVVDLVTTAIFIGTIMGRVNPTFPPRLPQRGRGGNKSQMPIFLIWRN